jgi:D-tyrosyl-tRNA(Tyr) deacylase
MKALIQRVSHAAVHVEGQQIAAISEGLVLFLGIEKKDDEALGQQLLEKVLHYRVFEDDLGKMNRSLIEIQGELLIVSQFTLVANTQKGRRPSFSEAASPELGKYLYDRFVLAAENKNISVATGVFGADMKVSILNNGPVTFWLAV